MKISTLKVSPNIVGVPSSNEKCKDIIMGYNVTVHYQNGRQINELVSPITFGEFLLKSAYKGYAFGESYFIIIDTEYCLFDSQCNFIKTLPTTGRLIAKEKDEFVIRKGDVVYLYNNKGEHIDQRDLTPEEIQDLDSQI